jgi:hypothetical protein
MTVMVVGDSDGGGDGDSYDLFLIYFAFSGPCDRQCKTHEFTGFAKNYGRN